MKKEKKVKEKSKTKHAIAKDKIFLICLCGIMSALYIGLDYIAVSVSAPFGGNLKISLSGLPIIIVSIFGGPIYGAATGLIGSFVSQMLSYGFSATTILWILPAVMRGVSMGLLFRAFKKSIKPHHLIIETCISSVVVTLFNTIAMIVDHKLYGSYTSLFTIYVGVPMRLLTGVITAILFSLMLPTIVTSLNKQNIAKL